jgi:hypothetical protein
MVRLVSSYKPIKLIPFSKYLFSFFRHASFKLGPFIAVNAMAKMSVTNSGKAYILPSRFALATIEIANSAHIEYDSVMKRCLLFSQVEHLKYSTTTVSDFKKYLTKNSKSVIGSSMGIINPIMIKR